MSNIKNIIVVLIAGIFSGSCGLVKNSPKTEFVDGYYTQKTDSKKKTVYVQIDDTQFFVYPCQKENKIIVVDTLQNAEIYQSEIKGNSARKASFSKNTLDIDFLTIPLKVRFGQSTVPAQLNANINGAVYLGCRKDIYTAAFEPDPLNKSHLDVKHYGFSLGLFTGFGNTAMTPTTTNNTIDNEYDGIVWSKGIAAIIAIDNFTAGLALGFDNLLDSNKTVWVYEFKPWAGLALGLNLN